MGVCQEYSWELAPEDDAFRSSWAIFGAETSYPSQGTNHEVYLEMSCCWKYYLMEISFDWFSSEDLTLVATGRATSDDQTVAGGRIQGVASIPRSVARQIR